MWARISRCTVAQPAVRAGVDLGVRTLATVATIDTATGEQSLVECPNPAPLKATLTARRRAGRELSRRIPGSRGWNSAKAKLARLDRRCVHLRREAAHQLTTELAGAYGQIVIEDLDLAAMKQSMRRRAFRRAVSDAAMGAIGPQLVYKTARSGATLTVADRGLPPARSTTAATNLTRHHAGWSAKAGSTSSWCARRPVKSWTATTTRPATSVTGRICQLTHSQCVGPARQRFRQWCRRRRPRPSARPIAWGARVRPSPTGRPRAMRPKPTRQRGKELRKESA
jgi:hypothetical protein